MKHKDEFVNSEDIFDDEADVTEGKNKSSEQLLDNDDNMSEEASPFDELQSQYDELNNKYLRLHAEFDNFRKRTVKEKADIIKTGGEKIVLDILPFADDFERALESLHTAQDKKAVVEGMELIYTKFVDFLQRNGIKEINAIGEVFDADKFEALTTVPVQEESQKGIIIDCIQKGYYLNDKIIRYPKVIVGE